MNAAYRLPPEFEPEPDGPDTSRVWLFGWLGFVAVVVTAALIGLAS